MKKGEEYSIIWSMPYLLFSFCLVEVKGPRDRLSGQQLAWLTCLSKVLSVEVLHVSETQEQIRWFDDNAWLPFWVSVGSQVCRTFYQCNVEYFWALELWNDQKPIFDINWPFIEELSSFNFRKTVYLFNSVVHSLIRCFGRNIFDFVTVKRQNWIKFSIIRTIFEK